MAVIDFFCRLLSWLDPPPQRIENWKAVSSIPLVLAKGCADCGYITETAHFCRVCGSGSTCSVALIKGGTNGD